MNGDLVVEDVEDVGERQDIVFEYELGRADFLDALKVLTRRRRGGFVYRPWFLTTLGVLVLLNTVLQTQDGRVDLSGVPVLVFLALLAFTPRLGARNALKANAHHGRMRMSAGEHGLTVAGAHSQSHSSWSNYGSCVETPRAFVLRSPGRAGRCASLIPKRGARTPADVDRLRALIGRYLPLT